MNPQPTSSEDTEALRREIQAAIAAGREVGPEMDQHLADSVLERYRQEQAARERALARMRPQPPQRREFGGELGQAIASNVSTAVVAIAGIAAFVLLLIFARDYWWVIFLLPWLLGALGWNRWSHRQRPNRYIEGPRGSGGSNGQGALTNTSKQSGQDVEIL